MSLPANPPATHPAAPAAVHLATPAAAHPAAPAAIPLDLSGRTALVTGAASGIGRACALRLVAAGAQVRAVDRDADGLAALHAAATRTGAESGAGAEEAAGAGPLAGELQPHPLDLTDLDAAERAADGVDVLVNNAGLQLVRPLHEFPPEDFETMLTVMLTAPFRLIRGALPHMYAQGWGRVVNISSVHGLRASAYKSAYVAAKHGLEGLSKVTALEGAPHGVTSNCVNPGYVRTPLVERQVADQAATHGIPADRVVTDVLLTRPAIKRMVEPAEVAEAVAYLCAPQSSMITGTSLSLDGGWTAS
ncbi:3-hydroxybutyrate dehydrogenase [Streptomyces buecherae]|uniref:3-hydroxybutyrate dehydrogenase n=2 Tax=Streptomyces buecherae TaxID=2763006 RepID=UPI00164D3240|nr:3-hydroxybutyrate dehydrogenase [Streptomyces buecherae]QNJ39615.1 3-hydroxybutyrate dehydrogenase [Streptomyces buecherae]